MTLPRHVERQVIDRASERCEYCRMHQALQGASFHVEHIFPRSLGGLSDLENLALACPGCNLRKADRIVALDPMTGENAPLFHPRNDVWQDHFAWQGCSVVARTPTGRATVIAFDLNHSRRLLIRESESLFGLWPPDEPAA